MYAILREITLYDGKTPVEWALRQGYNLSIRHDQVTSEIIKRIHNEKKKIGVWTVDDYELSCHYIYDMGVDALTSDEMLFD